MAPKTTAIETVFDLKTSLGQIWAALTQADHLANWFPTRAQVIPGVGGTITYQWGNSEFAGTADIIEWEAEKRLVTLEHHHGPDDTPLTLRTEYHLSQNAGGVTLRLVQSGFQQDEGWEDYTGAFRRGWQFELRGLRHYLEHHWGEQRHVIWARRQAKASLENIWSALMEKLGVSLHPPIRDGAALPTGRWDGMKLDGHIHIFQPPMDMCATLTTPVESFLRIKIDGWGQPAGIQDIHFWLSLYGKSDEECLIWQTRAQTLLDGLNLSPVP